MEIYAQQVVDIGQTYGGTNATIGSLVRLFLDSAIAIAGIIVIFMFIFAGIRMIAGAGNNDPKAAAQGRQALTYAIIGFIIIFTAYWAIRLIEIVTGYSFLTNPLRFVGGGNPPGGPAPIP